MLPVVIYSHKPQTELLSRIAVALEAMDCGGFVLREHRGRGNLALERGVLVIKDIKDIHSGAKRLRLGQNVVPILESCCVPAIKLIGACGLRAVCCGMSQRDTLTAESVTEQRSLLCLQRAMPTVDGPELEPCELIALTRKEIDCSSLLLTSGALLACGLPPDSQLRL